MNWAEMLAQLRKEKVALLDKADSIKAAAEKTDEGFGPEQLAEIDTILAEIEGKDEKIKTLVAQIDQMDKITARREDMNASAGRVTSPDSAAAIDSDSGAQRWPGRSGHVSGGFESLDVIGHVARNERSHGFTGMGDFAAAVYQANPNISSHTDERLQFMAAASGMSQGVGSAGGFLVPPEFSQEIYDGLNQLPDNLLARTDQFTVTGESLTFPANAETSRANGSRYGGVRGYWLSEADQITSSNPKLRQIKIEPQQLAVLIYATDNLLRNATALQQYLTRAATDEINFLTGDAIINGTGAGKPQGILPANAMISIAKETGQGKTVVAENAIKMWARLHPRSVMNAVWLINQEVNEQLPQMTIGVGTSGLPVYLPPGGLSAAPFGALFGRPVIPIEYCAKLGDKGDIILADLSAYVTGTRGGGIDSAMSIHLRFDYAETAFRFMFQVDGQPWINSAITPYKATSGRTLSPFVTLAAR